MKPLIDGEKGTTLHRYQSLGIIMTKLVNTILNFWMKVKRGKDNECWNWSGCTTEDGYGLFCMDYKQYLTHRLAWENRNGKIPKGMHVLHSCDNPKCCNPNHLSLGTVQENMKDKVDKERQFKGKHNQPSKPRLTLEDIADIKTLYDSGEYSQRGLARLYGVGHLQVFKIIHGKSSPHIKSNYKPHEEKTLTLTCTCDEDESIPYELDAEEE